MGTNISKEIPNKVPPAPCFPAQILTSIQWKLWVQIKYCDFFLSANVFVWGTLCSPPTKDRLVQFTEVLSFHLIYNVTGYYKWITKKLPFSPTLHWLLAVKLKHLSIFLDQFKLFLITFVLVCTQTCTTMCENQRTNCRSRFSPPCGYGYGYESQVTAWA